MASFLRPSLPGSAAGFRLKSSRYKRLAALFCCLLLTGALLAVRTGRLPHTTAGSDAPGLSQTSSASSRQGYEVYQAGTLSQTQYALLTRTIFTQEVCSDTLTLHYNLASPAAFGIDSYEATLGDFSLEAYEEGGRRALSWLEQLRQLPRENLDDTQRLTCDILSSSLELSAQLGDYYYYQEPLRPVTGLQAQLPVLLAEYHFRSAQDIQDYLALCADLPRYFEQILAFEQQKAAAGLFMSDAALAKVINQCRDFCQSPEENFMLSAFDEAVDGLDWLSEEERLDFKNQNRQAVLTHIIPAYEALAQGLSALQGQGHGGQGLCSLPQGSDYYRLLVRQATGSSRPAEELIQLISERLLDDLRAMSQIYQTTADLGDQLSRTFSLTDPELILMDLHSQMRSDFPALSDASCQVKYVPQALESHLSPAFYLVPPLDALTENCIYINQAATDASRLYTTLAHEGYPGHLYQTVYSASCQSEPLRSLLNFKGFTEGWATYVERLSYGYEENFSPELAEFLSRNASATLALYALCDLNIHLNGWSMEETGQFLRTWITELNDEAVREIYQTISADPANYLSYHVGAMEFELLREEAEERLGDAFDAREFHTVILETGACPFDVLRQCIEEWMVKAAGA